MTNQRGVRLRGPDGPVERTAAPPNTAPEGSNADAVVWQDEGGPDQPRSKRPGRLARSAAAYGWRAYAVPIMLAVTALAIVDAVTTTDAADEVAVDEPAVSTVRSDTAAGAFGAPPPGDGNFAATVPTGMLPAGGPVTERAAGTWHVVPGASEQVGRGIERVFTYTVEVEDGVDTTGYGGDEAFARMVDQTLANPKSWTRDERFAFRRIDSDEPTFRISLASQASTREACGFDIKIDSSCYNLGLGRVVLDEARWVRGATSFQGDIGSYRQYQINHEVGHAIGYREHQPCETDGGLAPIMMQQTFGTANNEIATLDPEGIVPADGKVCRFNAWPFPRG